MHTPADGGKLHGEAGGDDEDADSDIVDDEPVQQHDSAATEPALNKAGYVDTSRLRLHAEVIMQKRHRQAWLTDHPDDVTAIQPHHNSQSPALPNQRLTLPNEAQLQLLQASSMAKSHHLAQMPISDTTSSRVCGVCGSCKHTRAHCPALALLTSAPEAAEVEDSQRHTADGHIAAEDWAMRLEPDQVDLICELRNAADQLLLNQPKVKGQKGAQKPELDARVFLAIAVLLQEAAAAAVG